MQYTNLIQNPITKLQGQGTDRTSTLFLSQHWVWCNAIPCQMFWK